MKIVNIKTNKLIAYEYNPRNNEPAIEAVANSIKEFGFKSPIIIDKNNVIVAGHTRKLAADKLGIKEVPCIIADDLTPEQIKAYRLADNKTAELADWDFELLEKELAELTAFDFDMNNFGFDIEDIDINFPAGTEDDQGDLTKKEPKTTTCPNCGEIIEL